MAVGLGSMDMPVPSVAEWEWLNWKFPRAVHAGDTIYASVSNFSVVPFVAHLPGPAPTFVHDQRELDGVLEIPLDRLLDDTTRG